MKTPTPPYNGWLIVSKEALDGENPKNFHLVEAQIIRMVNSESIKNWSKTTLCGKSLKKTFKYLSSYLESETKTLRLELAKMQNGDKETCGNCVSQLYTD